MFLCAGAAARPSSVDGLVTAAAAQRHDHKLTIEWRDTESAVLENRLSLRCIRNSLRR